MLLVSESDERLINWFPDQNVDIVGLQDFPAGLDVLVATSWSTSFRVAILPARHKFYFVQSDETRFHPDGSVWQHLTRLSYAMGFHYLTEARWIQKWLRDGFGHKAALIPNGLDDRLFYPSEPLVAKGTRPRILLEGAIGLAYKGMHEAFEAVRDLDVEVWCVSALGKPKAGWRCDRFFEQVPMTEMRRIYSSCDILLKLSRVEGFFGPPMEMMACGGCVVVGKVTGYDEYIVDEVNALVVDPLQPAQASAAIRRIIEDESLRQRLVENGRETAAQWRWDPSIDALERYFSEVVSGARSQLDNSAKAELGVSVAYFYQSLMGIDLARSFRLANSASAGSDASSAGSNRGARYASDGSEALMLEFGATDKLLSWLRRKTLFRKFAVVGWRVHQMARQIWQRFA